jgi:Trypsin-like peptidase domain
MNITASSGYQSWTVESPSLSRAQGKHLMLRCSILGSSYSAQHTNVVPSRGQNPISNRSWSHWAGALVLGVLSLAWTIQGAAAADAAGFSQRCSGFAQDPLLVPLWPDTLEPEVEEKPSTALMAMVPRLSLHGTALATYERRQIAQTRPTLEAVFGLVPGAQREMTETPFSQDARAVVLYPNVLATVAHALTPDVVEVHVAQQPIVQTVPLRVTSLTLVARTTPEEAEVPAQVAHVNGPYDLALVQADTNDLLQPLPYDAVLSYGAGDPEKPRGGLQAGDCVAAIVTARNDQAHDRGQDRLVLGKVLAKVPVATNNLTQTKLNVNMFTTDLAVQPGDSGSPVLALRAGKPVLVGLVAATMYPTATFTYVSRIDPLLSLAEALQLSASRQAQPLLVQHSDRPGPQPQ